VTDGWSINEDPLKEEMSQMVVIVSFDVLGGSTSSITVTSKARDCCHKLVNIDQKVWSLAWCNDANSDYTSHTRHMNGLVRNAFLFCLDASGRVI